MSSVKVVVSTAEHLELVPDMPFGNKEALLNGPAYTLIVDGKPIAIGGVQRVWNGVGEAWVFCKPECWKLKKIVIRTVKDYLEKIINDEFLHRVQILVLDGHEAGIRFAEHLGFEHEGLMKQYGQQCESFHRFARLA